MNGWEEENMGSEKPCFGEACAKAVLFGEHAVVYGKAGIAVPLRRYSTRAEVTGAENFSWESDNRLTNDEKGCLERVFRLLREEGLLEEKARILLKGGVPFGLGLGSSASLSVALARALLLFRGEDAGPERVAELSLKAESVFHKKPSGIDTSTISFEKPVALRNKRPRVFSLGKPLSVVVASTGKPSMTSAAVGLVRQRLTDNGKETKRILEDIGEVAEQALECLKNGDVENTGYLMTKNHELLKELGVSSPELDSLVETALYSGALGAKMTGGGLGGCVVALSREGDEDRVAGAMRALGRGEVFSERVG